MFIKNYIFIYIRLGAPYLEKVAQVRLAPQCPQRLCASMRLTPEITMIHLGQSLNVMAPLFFILFLINLVALDD